MADNARVYGLGAEVLVRLSDSEDSAKVYGVGTEVLVRQLEADNSAKVYGVGTEVLAQVPTEASFDVANDTFDSWGIDWNGGIYQIQPRQKLLSNMLSQCAGTLRSNAKIELHAKDTTSQLTIDKADIKKGSFSYRPVWPQESDGGMVSYIHDADTPQDRPTEVEVISYAGQTTVENPTSRTLSCRFVRNSVAAQRLGILFFNRMLDKQAIVSFTLLPDVNALDLNPDDVVTLADSLYGETRDVLIDSMTINRDLSVDLECIDFRHGILGFEDETPSAVTVTSDASDPPFGNTTTSVPLIGIKINTTDFDTSSDGYAYIHGFNKDGEAADKNGQIIYDGDKLAVPRQETDNWTIKTSQEHEGHIIFDTSKAGDFTVNSNSHSVAFVKFESDTWYYDDGSSWQSFTLEDDYVIIGTLVRGASAITSANVWAAASDPKSIIPKISTISDDGGTLTINASTIEIKTSGAIRIINDGTASGELLFTDGTNKGWIYTGTYDSITAMKITTNDNATERHGMVLNSGAKLYLYSEADRIEVQSTMYTGDIDAGSSSIDCGAITCGAIDAGSSAIDCGALSCSSFTTSESVSAETDETKFSHKMPITISGSTYYVMLTDS